YRKRLIIEKHQIFGGTSMSNWFYNPAISFQMWGIPHLVTICLMLFLALTCFRWRESLVPYRNVIFYTVGTLLILSRISLDSWYIITGTWNVKTSLPLELCSIASLLCGLMLLTRSHYLFEVFYFIAIGGAIQAIVTPDLNFGFPQFRYFQ